MAVIPNFQFPQWDIDYQLAVLETLSNKRAQKLDRAIQSCLQALRNLNIGGLKEGEQIITALDDLRILRFVHHRYTGHYFSAY